MVVSDPISPVEDMTTLSELTESAILDNIRARYASKHIYTYTGSILVALNPYETLDIYGSNSIKQYTGKRLQDNPPHIYALAEQAIQNIRIHKDNQSVIISGESGAGKSESTKSILAYWTAATSTSQQMTFSPTSPNHGGESWIQQQVLEANTVLESFGNAKTVRNNNSSRFGKFIQVHLDHKVTIVGASIVSYLLEKSRIAKQAPTERNYHVFYEFLSGTNDEEKGKYRLSQASDYHYLSQSGCTEIPGVNDKRQFEGLKLAMMVLNMGPPEIEGIFRTLSAILSIGNVNFKEDASKESVRIANPEVVEIVSDLLGVDRSKLNETMCFRRLSVRNEVTMVPLKAAQALENRDSIAKSLAHPNTAPGFSIFSDLKFLRYHEFVSVWNNVFQINSFEQFCINYTNEKLQQFFNQFIFKLEQEEYNKENISWDSIKFVDNQLCLDLIEAKPIGILSLLDEETKVPKGSDESWVGKLFQQYEKNTFFIRPKTSKMQFGVKHYAGDVLYTSNGFLEKNKDAIQDELIELIQKSSAEAENVTKGGKAAPGPKQTAGAYFKNQLVTLVSNLAATTPHYVRCIKPNSVKGAFSFDETMVLSQLRYSGMLDTIKIRKAGYPMRLPFALFARDYKCLLKNPQDFPDAKDRTNAILNSFHLKAGTWQLGKTKLFLRTEAYDEIQAHSQKILGAKAITIQRQFKGFVARRKYTKIKESTLILQKNIKGFIYRSKYQKMRRCIIIIQSVVRGWYARDYYRSLKKKAWEAEQERKMMERLAAEKEKEKAATLAPDRKLSLAIGEGTSVGPSIPSSPIEKVSMESQQEAETLKLMAAAVQKKKVEAVKEREAESTTTDEAANPVDDLFSFLGDFSAANDLAKLAANLTSEIDSMLQTATNPVPSDKQASTAERNDGSLEIITNREQLSTSAYDSQEALSASSPSKGGRALKANPLGSSESLPTGKINPHSSEWSMAAFAEKNFELHEKKKQKSLLGLGKKSSKGTMQDVDEMLRHSKALDLQKVLDPHAKKPEETIQSIQAIVTYGIEHHDLRDEILVQIIKQMTPPSSNDVPKGWDSIVLHGWQILALCAGAFPPSKTFSKYFLAFIQRGISGHTETHINCKLAKIAEELFRNSSLNGPRKLPPSVAEINAMKAGAKTIPCRFHLLNGVSEEIPISPVTSAADVVKELAGRVNLRDHHGWSLYEVSWRSEHAIKSNEYIADIISSLEKESRKTPTPNSSVFKNALKLKKRRSDTQTSNLATGIFSHEIQLVMKRRVFKNPKETILDPVEHNLLYCQAVDHVNRDMFMIGIRDAIKLAALRAQVLLGDCDLNTAVSRFSQNINEWIAERLAASVPRDSLAKSIADQYAHLKGTSAIQAKFLYLETVKGFKYYGTSLYPAKYQGFWTFSENITLAVSSTGVEFLQEGSREAIMTFTYNEVKTFASDFETLSITINRIGDRDEESESMEVYSFTSPHAEEITSLMREYAPTKIGKTKEKVYSEQEIALLFRDVEKARAVLLEKNIVRRPGPEYVAAALATFTTSSFTAKNNRRFSLRTSKINTKTNRSHESLRPVRESMPIGNALSLASLSKENGGSRSSDMIASSGKLDSDYSDKDWSFSQTRLITSLLSPQENDIEDWAISLHSLIITYAGITSNGITQEAGPVPFASNIQLFLSKCMSEPIRAEELYLQLIKMTTNHPEPDSYQVLQLWRLMCVCVGVVVPATNYLLDYLKAHLRRAVAVDYKSKVIRKQEALCAKYCLKTLKRTLSTGIRRCPPSCDEILFATKQSPMSIRLHALTGQFRAVSVDPADTVESVFLTLSEKFNITGIIGFAIFTVFGGVERALYGDEKIADVLYKCEKEAALGSNNQKVHFTLKRRLHLNPFSPCKTEAEEEFVRAQAIEEIRTDAFPLSLEDSIHAAALCAQAAYGDAKTANLNYKEFISRHVSKRYLSPESESLLLRKHAEFTGKTNLEAKCMFMDFIRSRPLFGATIYPVMQSYTNEIPGECWMAVSVRGVQIMTRHAKVIVPLSPKKLISLKAPLVTHSYDEILSCSPSKKSILLITENFKGTSKYVFTTDQATCIASLIRDYMEILLRSSHYG
ncbi:cytochrome c oxidase subunit 1 [Phlyctochytrium planicorne]|nr:cytochrome c oxidase subunit 1 [Phlyctochytrium planicorne]